MSRGIMNMRVPSTLNIRCINAARFAFMFAPIDDISAVTQVPMLVPRMRKSTPFPPPNRLMGAPVVASAAADTRVITMDVTADDD